MRFKVEKMGINGEGIAYSYQKPVFIEGALQGEMVEADVFEKNKTYSRAKLIKVLEKSKDRRNVNCKYYKSCGGCTLLHANYEAQLKYKYDNLRQTLIKYAQVNPKQIREIKRNPYIFKYRNSFKLPLSMEKGVLVGGLYQSGTNYFVPVDHCLIHEEGLEEIRIKILDVLNKHHMKAFDFKKKMGLRTLIVRGFAGKYQCCIVSGQDRFSQALIDDLMAIDGLHSLWQSVHTNKQTIDPFGKVMVHLGGTRLLPFKHRGLRLNISAKSFFQLNTHQAETLYQVVEGMVDEGNDFIVEAYSGIGAISLALHKKAKEVVGIEYINDAVSNANQNAKLNDIENVHFVCGDAAEELMRISKKRKIDVLVVDPPRTGLSMEMLACIMKSKVKKIVYVSCNPATLAKNIAILKDKYEVQKVVPIDIFSHSAHVESVTLLHLV